MRFLRNILCVVFSLTIVLTIRGQSVSDRASSSGPSDTIVAMSSSKGKPFFCEVWINGAGCRKNVAMADSRYTSEISGELYDAMLNIGVNVDLDIYTLKSKRQAFVSDGFSKMFQSRFFMLCARFGLSYKYDKLAYKYDKFKPYGVQLHSLSMDMSLGFLSARLGMNADFLLKTVLKNNRGLDYVDFRADCFNKMTLRGYIGIFGALPFVEMELRIGTYLIPLINPDIYAYYNMDGISFDGLYFEVRLAFRLFSSGFNMR